MSHLILKALLLVCCLSLLPTASVLAQGGAGVGGDRPSAKTRRFPFKVVVTGFLNTDPAPDALAVIQLGVTGYRGDFPARSHQCQRARLAPAHSASDFPAPGRQAKSRPRRNRPPRHTRKNCPGSARYPA